MIESHDAVGAATMNAPSAPCVVPDPRFGAATDVGRLRSVNEDGYLATAPAFIVVDGMGVNSPENFKTEGATDTAGEVWCCPSILNISFLGTRGEVILHMLEEREIIIFAKVLSSRSFINNFQLPRMR